MIKTGCEEGKHTLKLLVIIYTYTLFAFRSVLCARDMYLHIKEITIPLRNERETEGYTYVITFRAKHYRKLRRKILGPRVFTKLKRRRGTVFAQISVSHFIGMMRERERGELCEERLVKEIEQVKLSRVQVNPGQGVPAFL